VAGTEALRRGARHGPGLAADPGWRL